METERKEYLKTDWGNDIKRFQICTDIINKLGDELSDSVQFSPTVYIIISCKTREDLKALMTLAPLWNKESILTGIRYTAQVEGEEIKIDALEAALPETCKLVEEEYEIPAKEAIPGQPAMKAKRLVLKCDKPAAVAKKSLEERLEEIQPWASTTSVVSGEYPRKTDKPAEATKSHHELMEELRSMAPEISRMIAEEDQDFEP